MIILYFLLGVSLALNIWLIVYLYKKKRLLSEELITEEKIITMAEEGEETGSIAHSQSEMISNIFDLKKTSVGDISTHRKDIIAIELSSTLEEVSEVISKEKYSRIMVYKENIDNIEGFLHVKDFAKFFMTKGNKKEAFDLLKILKKPLYVPFSKKTNELFQEMQLKKVHVAVIIDEYGGTSGIVTMEDMIEEIVGNIFDEYDLEEEEEISKIDDKTYKISGSCYLEDITEEISLEFSNSEDYDTIGGYIIGRLGRIPSKDEKIEILEGNWTFIVEKIEEKRIDKVLAIYNDIIEEEDSSNNATSVTTNTFNTKET